MNIATKLAEYLGEPLPYTDSEALKAHLVGLEALRYELAEARIDALKALHKGERGVLHPKDPQLTELDRKTSLQALTADLRHDYEILLALEEITRERLEFGRQLCG